VNRSSMRSQQFFITLALFWLPHNANARSWTDIKLLLEPNQGGLDTAGLDYLAQTDPYYFTATRPSLSVSTSTDATTISSTVTPTITTSTLSAQVPSTILMTKLPMVPYYNSATTPLPSISPKISANDVPTVTPSISSKASAKPTATPTLKSKPTSPPTATLDPYPQIPAPKSPDPWYFDYDTRRAARYGPGFPSFDITNGVLERGFQNNAWAAAAISPNNSNREFSIYGYGPWKGVLAPRDPLRNMCGRIGSQSPIDLRDSGAECEEHHQVRTRPGHFRLESSHVTKQIEPNKLRLLYERRPCSNLGLVQCQEPSPAMADYPNGWPGLADVMYIDFKIPSEHWIEGKRFDGEMQIFNLLPSRIRMPTLVSLIEATDQGYNYYFEELLRAFENQYDLDMMQCNQKHRRERALVSKVHRVLGKNVTSPYYDYQTWHEYSTIADRPDFANETAASHRKLQTAVWNPFDTMMIPSIHFWRYDGSQTEPPCGEFVSWFVSDTPMTISTKQLERMKRVLFTHVDPKCERTSVHYDQSVARPIQDTAGRPVSKCTGANFQHDKPVKPAYT
jgi:carbonic anhydrase